MAKVFPLFWPFWIELEPECDIFFYEWPDMAMLQSHPSAHDQRCQYFMNYPCRSRFHHYVAMVAVLNLARGSFDLPVQMPNISTDSLSTVSSDRQPWPTTKSLGVNASVGL
ncbi:MAG TPA: hypothetical protein VG077_16885 [Verrucomicrobiae bacterium]|nr:hypothetical protein [Verrucomicrobiae bacterium]